MPHRRDENEMIDGERIVHVAQIEAALNELGAQGWEVVTHHFASAWPCFTLKRRKPAAAA